MTMQYCVSVCSFQVAVDLIAERSAGGMVEMFYCTLPDIGEARCWLLVSVQWLLTFRASDLQLVS